VLPYLARVRVDEHNGSFHPDDGIACLSQVPIIKVPKYTCLVLSRTRLNGLVGLCQLKCQLVPNSNTRQYTYGYQISEVGSPEDEHISNPSISTCTSI